MSKYNIKFRPLIVYEISNDKDYIKEINNKILTECKEPNEAIKEYVLKIIDNNNTDYDILYSLDDFSIEEYNDDIDEVEVITDSSTIDNTSYSLYDKDKYIIIECDEIEQTIEDDIDIEIKLCKFHTDGDTYIESFIESYEIDNIKINNVVLECKI